MRQLIKKLFNYHPRAFTLIELVVAIGVALVVVSSTIAITILVQREVASGSNKFDSVQSTRVVVDRITRDLRQTNNIVTVLSDITDGVPGSNNIEFENGHDETLGINYIEYYLAEGNLIKQTHHYYFASAPETYVLWSAKDAFNQGPLLSIDSTDVVANNISNISFLKNGTSLAVFSVTSSTNQKDSTMQTQILLRNLEY